MNDINQKPKPPEIPEIKGLPPVEHKDVSGPPNPEFEALKYIIYGILIVVFGTFLLLVIQYFSATQTTFQDLKDKVIEQSVKIDLLYQECNRQ